MGRAEGQGYQGNFIIKLYFRVSRDTFRRLQPVHKHPWARSRRTRGRSPVAWLSEMAGLWFTGAGAQSNFVSPKTECDSEWQTWSFGIYDNSFVGSQIAAFFPTGYSFARRSATTTLSSITHTLFIDSFTSKPNTINRFRCRWGSYYSMCPQIAQWDFHNLSKSRDSASEVVHFVAIKFNKAPLRHGLRSDPMLVHDDSSPKLSGSSSNFNKRHREWTAHPETDSEQRPIYPSLSQFVWITILNLSGRWSPSVWFVLHFIIVQGCQSQAMDKYCLQLDRPKTTPRRHRPRMHSPMPPPPRTTW